jgi:hypothetical protein
MRFVKFAQAAMSVKPCPVNEGLPADDTTPGKGKKPQRRIDFPLPFD